MRINANSFNPLNPRQSVMYSACLYRLILRKHSLFLSDFLSVSPAAQSCYCAIIRKFRGNCCSNCCKSCGLIVLQLLMDGVKITSTTDTTIITMEKLKKCAHENLVLRKFIGPLISKRKAYILTNVFALNSIQRVWRFHLSGDLRGIC